ncbi:MAG: pyrroline-5-carboxylate reductase [Gammaproteobacteria bacterium]|nr:pyrroline-5-carboxylate reductase [Gammaproteobacteria bacterium]
MSNSQIGFIGAGNMASSLIGGLIADGTDPASLWVSDIDNQKLNHLETRFGVKTVADNASLVSKVDAVVMAVKPQVFSQVALQMAESVKQHQPLVISVAAGIRTGDMEAWFGGDTAIVRTMPNTPALVQTGATGLYANTHVSAAQKVLAENIMRAVGVAMWVEQEQHMDVVTALSGSGPAYYFYVMEAMEIAGRQLGLSDSTARLLTIQTALGAAKLAMESSDEPAVLRQRVTSPGGTTEQALKVLQESGLDDIFKKAMEAATKRAAELAKQYGVN